MDLKVTDQIFELRVGNLWVRNPDQKPVWNNRPEYRLNPEVEQWLQDQKIHYTLTKGPVGATLMIHDRKAATLFKLSWM